jgi:phosphoribosyl-ATP pyrophosphohydrolase
MTPEQQIQSAVKIFRKFQEQGVETVYGARNNGKIGLAREPYTELKNSSVKPENVELRSEEDIRKWLS